MLGWLAGAVFFALALFWILIALRRHTALPAPLAAAVFALLVSLLALYTGAFAGLLRWLPRRGLPALWLAAPLWVVLEGVRGRWPIAFPWAALGVSQYRFHVLAQMAAPVGWAGSGSSRVKRPCSTVAIVPQRAMHSPQNPGSCRDMFSSRGRCS